MIHPSSRPIRIAGQIGWMIHWSRIFKIGGVRYFTENVCFMARRQRVSVLYHRKCLKRTGRSAGNMTGSWPEFVMESWSRLGFLEDFRGRVRYTALQKDRNNNGTTLNNGLSNVFQCNLMVLIIILSCLEVALKYNDRDYSSTGVVQV